MVNEVGDITETTGPAWVTPVHDAAGNMTTVPKPADPTVGLTCTFDAWNRLARVEQSGSGVAYKYEFDGLNRRIVTWLDSLYVDLYMHFYYNASWQVLEMRDKNTDSDGLCDDERLYYLGDANFNVTTLVDTAGDAVERYLYDPYGKLTVYTPDWSSTRSGSNYANRIRYTGRQYDVETGFYHYRLRPYSVEVGRFLSRDPIEYGDGPNLNAYTRCNPIKRVDPAGLGCNIKWKCSLIAQEILGDERICHYSCRDATRTPTGGRSGHGPGGTFNDCLSKPLRGIPSGQLRKQRKTIQKKPWADLLPFVKCSPKECSKAHEFSQEWDFSPDNENDIFPTVDFKECLKACNNADRVRLICGKMPPGFKRVCKLAVSGGVESCKAYCQTFQK